MSDGMVLLVCAVAFGCSLIQYGLVHVAKELAIIRALMASNAQLAKSERIKKELPTLTVEILNRWMDDEKR